MTSDKTKIRSAATVIVVRNKHKNPSVLMGQRGVNAAFMPSKFVFPGGAVDDQDLSIDIKKSINEVCKKRLLKENENGSWSGLVAAAIRELFEETGLVGEINGVIAIRNKNDFEKTSIFICYDVIPLSEDIVIDGNEITDVKFIQLDDVKDINWISPAMKYIVISSLKTKRGLQLLDLSLIHI